MEQAYRLDATAEMTGRINRTFRPPEKRNAQWLSFLPFRLLLPLALFVCLAGPSAQAGQVFPLNESDRTIETLKKDVAYILTLSDEELRARVPVESGGIWFTDCPNCDYGSQDRGRFDWDPEKPHQIQCEGCQAVYPNNLSYPDDNILKIDAPEGTHRFAYWENPDTGYRIFFRAHADYLHRIYLERTTRSLGRLYAATGEDRYARAAAILLHRLAEVVPGYSYIWDFPYREKKFSPYTKDRIEGAPRYRTSLWTRWAYNDIPRPLLLAYDALHDWEGWEAVAGADSRETIEEDLFTFLVRFVFGFEDPLTNMSPRIWQNAIYAGRILDRPEWVHESIQRFERMLSEQFLHDGHWYETSPSYQAMTIGGMRRVMKAAEGHSDPAGYRHPDTGRRFDNMSLEEEVPQYGLAIQALERTRLPNGRLLPVNDSWAVHAKVKGEQRNARDSSDSLLMPGLGVAILGAGDGDDQIFSFLNFTSGKAHKQRDALAIGLFAQDKELLPDLGYTHTRYRRSWSSSMMAHNTVVVDGRESKFDKDHSGNRPLVFATNQKDFHLAAAESDAAYPDRTERFRRTLFLLGESASQAYLLDIFEAVGGNQHDYILHGNADENSRAVLGGTEMTAFDGSLVTPGAEYEEPVGEHDEMGSHGSFSFIRNLRKGAVDGPLTLDLRLESAPAKGSRTLLAPIADAEVYLGQSPSIRRAAESDAQLDNYFMPSFVLRRTGEHLDSMFVAAHEPVDREPRLEAIHSRRDDNRLWISVTHAGGRDYISLVVGERNRGSAQTPHGIFTTDAAYAVVRLAHSGAVRSAHLVEGDRLMFGDHQVQGPGAFAGIVRQISGGQAGKTVFELDEMLSVRDPSALIIEFPDGSHRGYSVTRYKNDDTGGRVHVREAAGFKVGSDAIEITSFPQRTIEGTTLRYRLIDSAHARME